MNKLEAAPGVSPTLGVPMVDSRCLGHPSCAGKDSYRMVGSCANCHSRVVGLFTLGHEAGSGWSSPKCPVCECNNKLYWKSLEDAATE